MSVLWIDTTAGWPVSQISTCLCAFVKNMSEFSLAVAYAISFPWQEHIVLKDKQLEVLRELYQGNDAFSWFLTG